MGVVVAENEAIDVLADPVDKIACRKCGRHLDVSKIPSFASVECPECKTKQTVPARLGQFLLLELLGAGGMGAVYQALDQSLGRYVAIKVMKQSLGDDPQFVENFLREARAAAALNHRNVVQIYSCGQEKGQPYIVMELVSGGRLDEMIAGGNPIEEVRALEIGIDVAEGLKAANDIGLIHGDVKPANVLFDREGVAKVADFGLARFVAWQQQDSGEIWGTPYYIAPEKARGQKVDHRSDIYSLGATLYHALGAKPPFDGKTATDVVLARLKNPAIGLRVIRPTLQPETADVIARMLEADPFMRYPTYSSLVADLREALRVAKQEQRTVRTKVKKTPVLPFVIVFLVIILAVVLAVAGLRHASRQKQEETVQAVQQELAAAQAAVEQVVTNAEPDLSLKKMRTPPIEQPFAPAGEEELAKAFNMLAEGNAIAGRDALQSFYDRLPAHSMSRFWVRMMQAVSSWSAGRDQEALTYLHEVRNALFEPISPTRPHPGNMPQALSRYMLKEIDDGALAFEAAKWPPWYGDLTGFYAALDALREGNLIRAREQFQVYANKKGASPAWPYGFQTLARRCIEQIDAFRAETTKADELVAVKQASKARTLMENYKLQTIPLLHPVVELRIKAIRVAEQKEDEESEVAARRLHQAKVQEDLDRIDEARTQNLPFLAQKDYRRASAAMTRLIPELKTSEAQQALALYRELYDRLDALKRFLIARISASPYRGASDLGGDAVSADLIGIRVALGQHGMMVIPWDQVSVRTYMQLVNHYLQDKALTDKERADMTLSAAVFCYESGAFKWATALGDKAGQMDSALKTKARQLMPDILSD